MSWLETIRLDPITHTLCQYSLIFIPQLHAAASESEQNIY